MPDIEAQPDEVLHAVAAVDQDNSPGKEENSGSGEGAEASRAASPGAADGSTGSSGARGPARRLEPRRAARAPGTSARAGVPGNTLTPRDGHSHRSGRTPDGRVPILCACAGRGPDARGGRAPRRASSCRAGRGHGRRTEGSAEPKPPMLRGPAPHLRQPAESSTIKSFSLWTVSPWPAIDDPIGKKEAASS